MEITDYWREPMDEEKAKEVLGIKHFWWAFKQGAAWCAVQASLAWSRNAEEVYGAYRCVERLINEAAHPQPKPI